jgi:hypothetical protein
VLTLATTLPPHETRRLGRLPKKEDDRTLKLVKYLPKTLPAIPDIVDWSTKMTDIGPMLNAGPGSVGDCGIAAPGHAEQAWTSQTSSQVIITDPQILQAYKDVGGYDGTPATDGGVNMLSACKYWRTTGIGGRKIRSFAILDNGNHDHIDFAINGFGGIYGGLDLPKSCQNQLQWSVSPGGTDGDPGVGSWGGHAIWIIGKDSVRRVYKFVSWGMLMEMTYDFWDVYGDESYACLSSTDWAENNLTPSGFDLPTLDEDLVAVAA